MSQMSLFKELSSIPSIMEKKQEDVTSSMKQTTELEAKFVMKGIHVAFSTTTISSLVKEFIKNIKNINEQQCYRTHTDDIEATGRRHDLPVHKVRAAAARSRADAAHVQPGSHAETGRRPGQAEPRYRGDLHDQHSHVVRQRRVSHNHSVHQCECC